MNENQARSICKYLYLRLPEFPVSRGILGVIAGKDAPRSLLLFEVLTVPPDRVKALTSFQR